MALSLQGYDLWIIASKIASQCRTCVARKLNVFTTTDGFSPTTNQNSPAPCICAPWQPFPRSCLGRSRINFTSFANPAIFFGQSLRKLIDYEGHIYNSKVASRIETCNPADGNLAGSFHYLTNIFLDVLFRFDIDWPWPKVIPASVNSHCMSNKRPSCDLPAGFHFLGFRILNP